MPALLPAPVPSPPCPEPPCVRLVFPLTSVVLFTFWCLSSWDTMPLRFIRVAMFLVSVPCTGFPVGPPTTCTCPHPGKSTVAAVLSQCFHGDPHPPPQGPCGICLGEGVSFSTSVHLFLMRAVSAPASCAHGFSSLISREDCVSFSSLAHPSIGSVAETQVYLNLLSSGYRGCTSLTRLISHFRFPCAHSLFLLLLHFPKAMTFSSSFSRLPQIV